MSRRLWPLAFLLVGLALAASPVPHQTSEDSLRSALNAVTRKQRSLDALPPAGYYGDLRSFKYHGEPEPKLEREEIPEMDDDDEDDLEFLPLENGQLENIGGGYRGFNNKRLERALMDYFETAPIQRETGTSSLFRERERNGARKRTMNPDHFNGHDDRELARLFLDELQNSPPYGEEPEDTPEYLPIEALQSLYDRYRLEGNNKLEMPGPMSWAEDDGVDYFAERERGQRPKNYLLYQVLPITQRRNVNGRYPIGREYRDLVKRFPVAKRSAKPFPLTSQATDPKVAQDLGALFGPQSRQANKTQDQKLSAKLNHVHNDDHNHMHQHTSERPVSFTTDVSSTTSRQEHLKDKSGTKASNTKERLIEVKKKKSVDWSQYFGIDRRRKKATLLARPGSQEQDDEWMLQRYYKTMADNLKTAPARDFERNGGEKRDKLDQMDEKLKNVKNVIIEDAVRYSAAGDNDADPQDVKEVVMARMAAAYSLEKMRKALNEFRNSIAAQRDSPKNSQTKNNNSSNNGNKDNSSGIGGNEKRSSNVIDDEGSPYEGFDEGKFTPCPELEVIERSCKPARNLVSGLFVPCVMHQICTTCDEEDECMGLFAMEAARVCDLLEEEGRDAGGHCARTALVISQMQPLPIGTSLCRGSTGGDSCLGRYQYRNRNRDHNRHRFSYYPYATRRHSTTSGFDTPMKR
ncbi:uncharacterized protein LOC107036844 [Diachasma alloeum]|uniref:uncharacterized protein LOC107036844 n=1 Tax=Diachasma alloeum TaxID=454923 RepID=UPI00073848F1|nr:uncharacterized protein LOC107036844 [Diachasma alloeum]XP_015110542.1 uncharacterized protein LOC107036844 [Diachasma alloeum]XP_015110543.1 uncharacterized protein LOC107036844 [Diachasma alloeum]